MLPSQEQFIAIAASLVIVVVVAVLLHYEALPLLSRFVARTKVPPRPRRLVLVVGLLAAHVAKTLLFALCTRALLRLPGMGNLSGREGAVRLPDVVHPSAITCATLGYGDPVPRGDLRLLFGMEALTGLVLITWSASLGFLEMQRHWQEDRSRETPAGKAPEQRADGPREWGR